MAETNYHEFDPAAVDRAIAAAKAYRESTPVNLSASSGTLGTTGGHLTLAAECIGVTIQGGRVCINLPLGIGRVCLPIPLPFPDGTSAQACLSICTPWFVPTGVRVTVYVNGQIVVQQTFGVC